MNEHEFLYRHDSLLITLVLFISIMVANELGFRIGRFVQNRADSEIKSLTGSIQASILGLLALLLGFTFSMSLHRFDNRSLALVAEANAIGTTALRVQLLPESYQNTANELMREYIEHRISIGKIDLTRSSERSKFNRQISDLQKELWSLAVEAAGKDPRPVTTRAFITSLNETIDSQGRRNALLQMHVPEVVLLLLLLVFIASGGMLGYSSGLDGKRVLAPTIMMTFLISMIAFIIIDLDRPKRCLIQVNQGSMLELLQSDER